MLEKSTLCNALTQTAAAQSVHKIIAAEHKLNQMFGKVNVPE